MLANVARAITLPPEEAVCFTRSLGAQQVAGRRSTCLWFVVSGCVSTYTTDTHGREHNLAFSTEG